MLLKKHYFLLLSELNYNWIFQNYKYQNYLRNLVSFLNRNVYKHRRPFKRKHKNWYKRLYFKKKKQQITFFLRNPAICRFTGYKKGRVFTVLNKVYKKKNINLQLNSLTLIQRIFLTKKLYKKIIVNRYIKAKKKIVDVNKSYLSGVKNKTNIRKKVLLYKLSKSQPRLFFKARNLQWSLYSRGTIREYRYAKFLKNFFKKVRANFHRVDYKLVYFSMLSIPKLLWNNIDSTEVSSSFTKINTKSNIISLTIAKHFWKILNIYEKKKFKQNKKVNKWLWVRRRIFFKTWLHRKKKMPKFFIKFNKFLSKISKNSQHDKLTNTILIHNSQKINYHNYNSIYMLNTLIRLYNFRYIVLLQRWKNIDKVLTMRKKFKKLELKNLISLSLAKNKYTPPQKRIIFLSKKRLQYTWIFNFKAKKNLICNFSFSFKVPSHKINYSRFVLNKRVESLMIGGASK